MPTWRTARKLLIAFTLAFVCLVLLWVFMPVTWRYREEIRNTEKVVARLESFKQARGQYPEDTDWSNFEVEGVDFERNYFYTNQSGRQQVGFNLDFDRYCYYDLHDNRWHFDLCD